MSQNSNHNSQKNDISNKTNSETWTPDEIPQLTVDVYRDSENIYIVSTVAGISPEDIDISMDNNTLSIKGVRNKPYDDQKQTLLLEECFWGEFHRDLTINENLNVDKIEATINQGILKITIPILKISNSKKIQVNLVD